MGIGAAILSLLAALINFFRKKETKAVEAQENEIVQEPRTDAALSSRLRSYEDNRF